MVKDADGHWVFEGPPIRFDADGVYPMVDDPDTATLPDGSLVKASSRQFNATYADLLRSLHHTVNGDPAGLREAIGLMYTLPAVIFYLFVQRFVVAGMTAGSVKG